MEDLYFPHTELLAGAVGRSEAFGSGRRLGSLLIRLAQHDDRQQWSPHRAVAARRSGEGRSCMANRYAVSTPPRQPPHCFGGQSETCQVTVNPLDSRTRQSHDAGVQGDAQSIRRTVSPREARPFTHPVCRRPTLRGAGRRRGRHFPAHRATGRPALAAPVAVCSGRLGRRRAGWAGPHPGVGVPRPEAFWRRWGSACRVSGSV